MASFDIHLAIAILYAKKNFIKNKEQFFCGIVEPDFAKDKTKTHYTGYTKEDDLDRHLKEKVNLKLYLQSNSNLLKDEIDLDYQKGIFLHLITDYYFYNDFYELDKRFDLFLRYVHKFVFSGHNVDRDIAIGSEYLKELLLEQEPLNGRHINVTTQMLTTQNCSSFQDYFCYFLEWATEQESDGIVKREAQRIDNCEEYFLDAPHESSLRRGMMMLKEKNIIEF